MNTRIFVALGLLVLSGCATLPAPTPETAECRSLFTEIDALIAAKNAGDAGAHRIGGLPYLRSNRFLASFRGELNPDTSAFALWVEQMRVIDLDKRSRELQRTGLPAGEQTRRMVDLDRCGQELAQQEMSLPRWREHLIENVAVPDDYSTTARALGLYAFAVPFLNLGIASFHDDVRADYARPLDSLDSPAPLTLWSLDDASRSADAIVASPFKRDALGIPRIPPARLQFLAERHAPSFWVETASNADRLGAIRAGEPPIADTRESVVYFLSSFTRYGGDILPQLIYVAWFPSRPAQSPLDSYAGALDGIVWRVTLDSAGEPLLYDTIHPCGCYHYFFPVQPMALRPAESFWQEPVLAPQVSAPGSDIAIRVQATTHFVRRVISRSDAASDEAVSYVLRPYSDLEILPAEGQDSPVSLFDPESGIVRGTERGERFWLWPSGVPSPGAMRQWGRHATSFVGKGHFDEGHLLDRLFEPPAPDDRRREIPAP